jgi:hypothetical protein
MKQTSLLLPFKDEEPKAKRILICFSEIYPVPPDLLKLRV